MNETFPHSLAARPCIMCGRLCMSVDALDVICERCDIEIEDGVG